MVWNARDEHEGAARRRHAARWVPDVIVSVFVIALAFGAPPIPEFRSTGVLTTCLMLLPLAILPWRRKWPLGVLLALLALFGATAFAGTLSPGIGLAVAVAMFHFATRRPRRDTIVVGSAAAIGIVVLSFPISIGSVYDPRVLQFAFLLAFAAAAGDGARSRRAYVDAIMERAERAEQTREAEARRRVSEERLRIARDLHDAVAHQIAVISLSAGVATASFDSRPERAKEALSTIRGAARTVLGEIGDLLGMLRTADQDDTEETGPQPGMGSLDDLVAQFRQNGLSVDVRTDGDRSLVRGVTGRVVYKVVQEALTNAHKHGAEHRAHVLLDIDHDRVIVVVTNPVGADLADERIPGSGLGLIGLNERVASVRGSVEAAAVPAGWRLRAVLPVTVQERP